jgi:tetratricopeptide (TPR) repeat protein
MKTMQRWVVAMGMIGWTLAGVSAAMAANVMYLKNGSTIQAKSIQWREGAQEYRVEDFKNTVMPIPLAQVQRLDVDKPVDFDRAKGMVEGGQAEAAVPILEKMVDEYRMRLWDNRARELLGKAYFQKRDYKKAGTILEELFKNALPGQITPELRRFYWETLMLIPERQSTLKKDIEATITSGSRDLAASAILMRAELYRNQGQKEDALVDYLKVAVLFEDVPAIHPEALYKAAEVLDEMRDPRAAEMRKKLKAQYPGSSWAKKDVK